MKENKLFQGHETDRAKAERATADYNRTLAEIGAKVQTRADKTPAMEDRHHGRAAAGENRRK
jgi:hypothetical protein